MAIKISDLMQDERTCEMVFDGETAKITYRPSGYTPTTEDALQKGLETQRPSVGVASLLSELLLEWEVMDDDGQALPINLETLQRLPAGFLYSVMNAIIEDMTGAQEGTRKNSGVGLPQKASTGNARRSTFS